MSSLAECKLYDAQKKRRIATRTAVLSAILAVALFNPWTLGMADGLVGSIFNKENVIANNGRPTAIGLLVQTLVLFILAFILFYWRMSPSRRPLVCCDPSVLQVKS